MIAPFPCSLGFYSLEIVSLVIPILLAIGHPELGQELSSFTSPGKYLTLFGQVCA